MTRFGRIDAIIVAVGFVAAAWFGTVAVRGFRAAGGVAEFYQSELGPAVMVACGRGLQNADTSDVPALTAFLGRQSETFDCALLPPHVEARALRPFQASSTYLQLAVAATWRLAGVSWSALDVLSGMCVGAVAALTFAIMRLSLARPLAVIMTAAAVLWPPNLTLAPQLRDYAKGPFLLAVVFLLGLIAFHSDRHRLVRWAVLAGAVVGVGVGFRTDVMIAVVPVAVTIAALVPREVPVGRRVAAVAAFAVALVAVASPALRGYARGGNTAHVALLGFADDFNRTLRIEPSVYQLFGPYNDTLAFSVVNGFAARVGDPAGANLSTAEYDRLASRYLTTLVATFPADVAVRGIAALRALPRYVLDSSLTPPAFVPLAVRWAYRIRGSVSSRLAPLAVLALVVAVTMVGAAHPRAAVLALFVFVVFGGASAIQFHERHFYYLQFVPWLAFGVIIQGIVTRTPTPHARAAAIAVVAMLASAALALTALRAVQHRTVEQLLSTYDTAPRTTLSIDARDHAGSTLLTTAEWMAPLAAGAARVPTRFVAVQFDASRCGAEPIDVTARYTAVYADADLSETWTVSQDATRPSPSTMFVVAYDRADESIRFRGIEVPARRAACIAKIARVEGLERSPLLLHATLASDWRDDPLHQRLR